jgi:hypothetical protein
VNTVNYTSSTENMFGGFRRGQEVMEKKNGLLPVHPGEIIQEDILPSVGLSVTATAKALGVSRQMLHDTRGKTIARHHIIGCAMIRVIKKGSTNRYGRKVAESLIGLAPRAGRERTLCPAVRERMR